MPKLLTTPFAAESQLRTNIQESQGAESNSATYRFGFPEETMKKIALGGKPPKGEDMNGILYDLSENIVFQTQGGRYKFDPTYANKIGGYPVKAVLQLENGAEVINKTPNNTTNPNVDMTGWGFASATKDSELMTWSGRTQESVNKDSIHVLDFKLKDGVEQSDQDTIQDAVNYCLPRNLCLNFEGAHLTATKNIENFWGISHKGQGSITRDGFKFNITPILAQSSETHIKDGALTHNDGISPSFPTTPASAFNYLSRIGCRASLGTWRIRIWGVIKSAPVSVPSLPIFLNHLELVGQDVVENSEPISVWDGTGRSTYAVNFGRNPVKIKIKNLTLQNWSRVGGNSGGFVFQLDSDIFTDNARFRKMNIGIWTQKSYLQVINTEFEDISTFGCSVSYNGYGNIGTVGNGNKFNRCNIGAAVSRGAIAYVTDNIFDNIQGRAIEINKNARCREHGNKYVKYDEDFTGSQCCVLVEEGAVFNNDNLSGLPSTITAKLTSDKPFLKLLSGGSFQAYDPLGFGLHSTASLETPYLLATDDLINLNSVFNERLLALPAFSLYASSFSIKIQLAISVPSRTSVQFKLNGQGESSALTFASFNIPELDKATNFPIEFVFEKMAGSDIVNCYASAPRINYYSSVSRNQNILNQKLVRDASEDLLIFRPYIQRVTGTGQANIFSCKVFTDIQG